VVVGTRSLVAAGQLLKARDELGLPILEIDIVGRLEPDNLFSRGVVCLVEEARSLLKQGRGLALSSTFSSYVPVLTRQIPLLMAETVVGILDSGSVAGIFLSGGDIAMEVCRRLWVTAIQVRGEVEPGVPAGELVGGQHAGMRVVTKAGGLGSETALVKSISYLKGGRL
jgi:uncharacterized protein YgbK (DUF1537 family)